MSYHVGDLWKLTFTVTDPSATNPTEPVEPSALTVAITKPDGSTEAPVATKSAVGVYKTSINLTQPGRWHAVASTTGTYQATQPKTITVLED
jgi:hypothetical protein